MRTTFPVAAPAAVWAALGDPDALAAALPGCRSVTADGDGALHVVAEVAVASVRGLWSGTVVPLDADAVRVVGSGAPGAIDLVVRADPERTALTVEGTVDGPLGAIGSTVLAAAARRTADDLLAAMAADRNAVKSEVIDSPSVPSPESRGPGKPPARRGLPRAEAIAVLGVAVAVVLRRRARRRTG